MCQKEEKVKKLLEDLYKQYNSFEQYQRDPIIFPHRYSDERDIEIAGLIASSFAYGRLELFMAVLDKIFKILGDSPADFVENFDFERDLKYFDGINYRFNNYIDVIALIYSISESIKKWGSLKNLFQHEFNKTNDIKSALIGFVNELKTCVNNEAYYHREVSRFDYLLISPEKGSACKRLNLFLRWMVRDKDIDFGIWKEVGKENLVIPLDTHVGDISRCLGLLRRKSNDWKAALELTNSLKKFDPHDPVKYDFALCHIGIDGVCNRNRCDNCEILKLLGQDL